MEFKDNGDVTLYGQSIVVLPDALMVEYILNINNDPDWKKVMYQTAKEAMLEYKPNFIKVYNPSSGPVWVCNTVNLLGQGKIQYAAGANGLIGTILLENSPTARGLKGNVNEPTDHIMRGIIAGIVSSVLDMDIDVVEVECAAAGGAICELIVGSSNDIKNKFADIYAKQI